MHTRLRFFSKSFMQFQPPHHPRRMSQLGSQHAPPLISFTSLTRADGSIGKVTTEISQRSASRCWRMPSLRRAWPARCGSRWRGHRARAPSSAGAPRRPWRRPAQTGPPHKARAHPPSASPSGRAGLPDRAGRACDAGNAAFGDRARKCPRSITSLPDPARAEQARIAGKPAFGSDALEFEGQEFVSQLAVSMGISSLSDNKKTGARPAYVLGTLGCSAESTPLIGWRRNRPSLIAAASIQHSIAS